MGSEEQARHRATRRHNTNPTRVGVALTRRIDVTDGRDIVVYDAIGYDGHRYLPFRTGVSGTEASTQHPEPFEECLSDVASQEVAGPVPPHDQLDALVEITKSYGHLHVSIGFRLAG